MNPRKLFSNIFAVSKKFKTFTERFGFGKSEQLYKGINKSRQEFSSEKNISKNFIVNFPQSKFYNNQYSNKRNWANILFRLGIAGTFTATVYQQYQQHEKNLTGKLKQDLLNRAAFVDLLVAERSLPIENIFINLSVVEIETQKKKPPDQIKSSDREELFSETDTSRKKIDIDKLINSNAIGGEKVIVIGGPGAGKSTFCQHLAYRWAKDELYQQFEFLFWIKLRDLDGAVKLLKERGRPDDLCEILNVCCFNENLSLPQKELLREQLGLKKILFLLDGRDELDFNEGAQRAFTSLLRASNYAIVTSRPHFISDINARKCFEIINFSVGDTKKYIDNFFSNKPDIAKSLTKFIGDNPYIRGLARVPLSLEIICHLWMDKQIVENGQSLNMTDLYRLITLWILKHKCRRENRKEKFHHSPQDLEKNFAKEMQFLREIALQALLSATTIVDKDIVKKSHELFKEEISLPSAILSEDLGNVVNLGFLKKITTADSVSDSPDITNKKYYFLHLTLQEFLAAERIASILTKDMHQFGTPMFEYIHNIIAEHKYNPQFEIVWWFVAGLLAENKNDVKPLQRFFDILHESPRDMAGIYELGLFIRCLDETKLPINFKYTNLILQRVTKALRSFISDQKYSSPYELWQRSFKGRYYSASLAYLFGRIQMSRIILAHPLIQNIFLDAFGKTDKQQINKSLYLFLFFDIAAIYEHRVMLPMHIQEILEKSILALQNLINSSSIDVVSRQLAALVVIDSFTHDSEIYQKSLALIKKLLKSKEVKDSVYLAQYLPEFNNVSNQLLFDIVELLSTEKFSVIQPAVSSTGVINNRNRLDKLLSILANNFDEKVVSQVIDLAEKNILEIEGETGKEIFKFFNNIFELCSENLRERILLMTEKIFIPSNYDALNLNDYFYNFLSKRKKDYANILLDRILEKLESNDDEKIIQAVNSLFHKEILPDYQSKVFKLLKNNLISDNILVRINTSQCILHNKSLKQADPQAISEVFDSILLSASDKRFIADFHKNHIFKLLTDTMYYLRSHPENVRYEKLLPFVDEIILRKNFSILNTLIENTENKQIINQIILSVQGYIKNSKDSNLEKGKNTSGLLKDILNKYQKNSTFINRYLFYEVVDLLSSHFKNIPARENLLISAENYWHIANGLNDEKHIEAAKDIIVKILLGANYTRISINNINYFVLREFFEYSLRNPGDRQENIIKLTNLINNELVALPVAFYYQENSLFYYFEYKKHSLSFLEEKFRTPFIKILFELKKGFVKNSIAAEDLSLKIKSPLHIAVHESVEKKDDSILIKELNNFIDLDAVDESGETALMAAVRLGDKKNVEILLKHGAKINIFNNDSKDAINICFQYIEGTSYKFYKDYWEIFELLIQYNTPFTIDRLNKIIARTKDSCLAEYMQIDLVDECLSQLVGIPKNEIRSIVNDQNNIETYKGHLNRFNGFSHGGAHKLEKFTPDACLLLRLRSYLRLLFKNESTMVDEEFNKYLSKEKLHVLLKKEILIMTKTYHNFWLSKCIAERLRDNKDHYEKILRCYAQFVMKEIDQLQSGDELIYLTGWRVPKVGESLSIFIKASELRHSVYVALQRKDDKLILRIDNQGHSADVYHKDNKVITPPKFLRSFLLNIIPCKNVTLEELQSYLFNIFSAIYKTDSAATVYNFKFNEGLLDKIDVTLIKKNWSPLPEQNKVDNCLVENYSVGIIHRNGKDIGCTLLKAEEHNIYEIPQAWAEPDSFRNTSPESLRK